MEKGTKRQSNFELLRIVAIIMIISSHLVVHSNISFNTDAISFNRLWIQFYSTGGKVGFNLFVMISGYFLSSVSEVKTSRVIRFILQTTFYSLIIYFILVLLGIQKFQLVQAIESLFPIPFSIWGFASAYFVLYLLFPFINTMLNNLSKNQYIGLLLLMFVIWSVIPTFTSVSFQCNYVTWMTFLYSIGAYIRKFYKANSKQKKNGCCYLFYQFYLFLFQR